MGLMLTNARAATLEPLGESAAPDQRAHDRYPICLDLQYKLLRGSRVEQAGTGRTVNISSGGVLFETSDWLPARGSVELALQWPFLLQGVCGLKLVIRGRIVRSDSNGRAIAVRAVFHEFRTAGLRCAKSAAGDH
jgi:hypothetical protein